MDQYNLNRFLKAQLAAYEGAMVELAQGRKDSHWIWYIFPQIVGLGCPDPAKHYAIKSLEEGQEPPQPQKIKGEVIRTNGQDTVLRAPKRNKNDREFVKLICSSVMEMQFDLEDMPLKERDNNIINNLQKMEERGSFDKK